MALIKYKTSSVRIIPDPKNGGNVMIQGGINEIENQTWGRIRQHVLDLIGRSEKHTIEEIGIKCKPIVEMIDGNEIMEKIDGKNVGTGKFEKIEKPTGDFEIDAKPLSKLDKQKAVEIIGETFSIQLLNKWFENEAENQFITNAITKQLNEIEKHGSKKTDDGDE